MEKESKWGTVWHAQSSQRILQRIIQITCLGGLVFLLGFSGVYGETPVLKDPLVEHLEFLGYECDQVEAGVRAKHVSKIHLYITYAFGGIRLQTGFPGKAPYSDVGSRYKVTNALAKQLSVMQLYWSEEGNLFAMGWMPGMYEKARFAVLMEAWDHDTAILRQAYEDLKPFLKEAPMVAPKAS